MAEPKDIPSDDALQNHPAIARLRAGGFKTPEQGPMSPRLTALRNQDKLNRKAAIRTRIVNGKVQKYKAHTSKQDLEAIAAEIIAADKQTYAEIMATAKIGQFIEGHGVFLGTWRPEDNSGFSLRKTFNVFAAPEDLPGTMTYNEAVQQVADLKAWNGHNGTSFAEDTDIFRALRNGSYDGGWFIPPRELLIGTRGGSVPSMQYPVHADSLVAHMNEGALKGSFRIVADTGYNPPDFSDWYWSSTAEPWADGNGMRAAGFGERDRGDREGWFRKTGTRLSCRPIRLELKP